MPFLDWLLTPAEHPDLALLRVSRRAMATTFEIAIPFGTPNALDAAHDALDLIDDIEDQLTIYRDHSEISQLNQLAAAKACPISEPVLALLQQCAGLTQETAGAFDAAMGQLIQTWGFQQRQGRVPSESELAWAKQNSGFRHVVLDPEKRLCYYRQKQLILNMGGIGKGYALDQAAKMLQNRWGISSALLHAGGSSARAIGCPANDARGWSVRIRHPHDEHRTLGTVFLDHEGMGTSAATFQYFEYNGKQYGHVLDPRTGRPCDGTASATCVAPTATDADALSTAFFVAGATWTETFCRSRDHYQALLLETGETVPRLFNILPSKYQSPGWREPLGLLAWNE